MQIAVFHELYPKETISDLAHRLMYSPVFVINALDEGEKMELFSRIKGEDKLIATTPVDYQTMMGLEFGTEQTRIQNELLRAIASANKDEDDVEEGTLQAWCRGIRPSDIELALHTLQKIDFVSKYELANPKDKESKYTFYTLRINEGKEWGLKQFKDLKPAKKKK
jgi:DNA-binding MarR family transcriptional regulator